jgi:hypothetical protein
MNALHLLLTPWSRVLLKKLIAAQRVNKFSAFYGTRRIIAYPDDSTAQPPTLSFTINVNSILPFAPAPASRPALGPTQPPIQWVPRVLSPGVKRGRSVMLTTHPHLVPRLSMSRSYTSSPPMCLHGV